MVENLAHKENSGMEAGRSSDDMSITVNGQSRVPPGFRFHPTEEELLNYYLRKKVACEKIDLDVIRDVDLNKLEPWDIQEKCRVGSTPQNDWYFFSHKDKKYPTGTRTNRATAAGFWKATGRDKVIHTSCRRIGMRKTLVFYKGRAPHGQKSDWIMHEYRLDDHQTGGGQPNGQLLLQDPGGSDSSSLPNDCGSRGDTISEQLLTAQEEGWVVCRVFKKKNYHKELDSPKASSASSVTTTMPADVKMRGSSSSSNVDARSLDQILQYMGRSGKQEAGTGPSSSRAAGGFHYTGCAGGNQTNNNATNTATTAVRANSVMKYSIPFDTGLLDSRFMKLPPLESPSSLIHSGTSSGCCGFPHLDHVSATQMPCCSQTQLPSYHLPHQLAPADDSTIPEGLTNDGMDSSNCLMNPSDAATAAVSDWVLLDRLVASHLNGQSEASCFDEDEDPNYSFSAAATNRLISGSAGDMDLWAFAAGGGSSSSGSEGQLYHRSTPLGPD